jgi:hypothetical protein
LLVAIHIQKKIQYPNKPKKSFIISQKNLFVLKIRKRIFFAAAAAAAAAGGGGAFLTAITIVTLRVVLVFIYLFIVFLKQKAINFFFSFSGETFFFHFFSLKS